MAATVQGCWWPLIVIIAVLRIITTTTAQMKNEQTFGTVEAMMGDGLGSLTTVAEVEQFLDHVRRATKMEMAKNFAKKTRLFKRDLDLFGVDITAVNKIEFSSLDTDFTSANFTAVKYFTHNNRHFLFCAQNSNYQQFLVELMPPGNFGNDIMKLEIRVKFIIESGFTGDITIIAAHVFNGEIWLALANGDEKKINMLSITWPDETLPDLWKSSTPKMYNVRGCPGDLDFFKTMEELFLVVGNRYKYDKNNTRVDSWLFTLRSGNFDIREDMPMNTQGVSTVTTFHDHGKVIIVFGCQPTFDSWVYIFNPLLKTLEPMDWVFPNVSSVQHYSDTREGKEEQMIIITRIDKQPEIYRWTDNEFEWCQTIEQKYWAYESIISTVQVDEFEDIVALSNGNIIELFVDNLSAEFVHEYTSITTCSSRLKYLQLFHDQDTENDFIIYSCDQSIYMFHIIHHKIQFASEPEKADELISCMDELEEQLEERKEDISYLEKILQEDLIMSTDHDQIWHGPITFMDTVTVEESAKFNSQVTVMQNIEPQMVETTLPDLVLNLQIHKNRSEELDHLLENVLTFSGEQTIFSADITNSLVVDVAIFNKLNIEILNGVPVNNLENYFLMHNIDQTINTQLDFTTLKVNTFSTRGLTIGTINNMYTSDLMRKSVSNQIVTGNHVYTNIHMDGHIIHPDGPDVAIIVNGISSDTWIMEGSDVTFTRPATFTNLSVINTLNTSSINTVSVKDLFGKAIFTDDVNSKIKGNLTIQGDLIVKGNIDVPSVNGIDIVALDLNTVKKKGDFVIQGPVEYRNDLYINQDLTVVRVNDILWSDIIDLYSDTEITSVFKFGNVTVTGDVISDDINGMDISEDAVLIHGDQVIEGRVVFENSMTVENQVFMEEFTEVNGVDPSDLKNSMDGTGVVFIDTDIVIQGTLEVFGNLSSRVVNNISLSGFEDNYWRKTKDQTILFNTQMPQAVFNAELTVGTLNNVKTSDYLHNSGDQTITGEYIFDDNVTIKGDLVMAEFKTIDSVDLSELEKDVVTLDGDQIISGITVFEGHVDVMQNVEVSGAINGISIPNDVMLIDVANEHTGFVNFTGNIQVTHLEVDHNINVGSVNGYDLSEIVADTVYKNENVTIYGPGITFRNEIVVTENLEVTGLIDGVNFTDFVSRTLKKNSDVTQHVTGNITVEGSAYFGGILNLKTVNDLDWESHLNNVVDVNYNGLISGKKTFTELIVVNGDLMSDNINHIDLSYLETKILSRTKEQIITSHYNFTDGLRVGSIQSRYIDGVDTYQLLRTDQDVSFTGIVTFKDDIILNAGLFAPNNTVDGCNLDKLDRNHIWTIDDEGSLKMPPSDLVVGTLTVNGNVYTRGDGKVVVGSEVDFDYFVRNLVTKTGDHTITGAVTFLGNVTVEDLVATYLGGVLVEDFLYNSVRKSVSQTIHGDLVFENNVNVEHLTVNFDVEKREEDEYMTVNGINLFEMNKNVVRRKDESVVLTGNKAFINGLSVKLLNTDFIGGIPVSEFVLLNTDKVISNVSFSAPITIKGNLQVKGLLDDVDLNYLLNNRITLDSNQEISGNITFADITVNGDLDVEIINDVQISDLVLRNGQETQVISGSKTMQGGLTITGSIQTNSTINDFDIMRLNRTIVRKNQPAVLSQNVVFEKTVFATNSIVSNGMINDWMVEDLPDALITLNNSITHEAMTVREMLPEIDQCNLKNYKYAQGLFEELSYVQRLSFTRLENAKFVRYVDNFIYVTVQTDESCMFYDTCFCTRRTYTYNLTLEGTLGLARTSPGNPDSEPLVIEGSYYPVTHPFESDVQYGFTTVCENGVPHTHMRFGNGSSEIVISEKLTEAVDQIERFVYKGKIYFVMVTPQEDIGDKIIIMSYVQEESNINHTILTDMHGLSISITEYDDTVYLLINGHLNVRTAAFKKFVTNSLIYVWNGDLQQFEQTSHVRGSHVTAGTLVTVKDPKPVVFIILSQLKNADTDHFHSNQKFNKPALIFKHTNGSNFNEYEALEDVMGATAHTYFRVNRDLHLCFTVPKDNAIYIYKYVPMEGFILQQKATLSSPENVIRMEIYEGGRSGGRLHGYLAVTSFEGIYIFKMKTKGVNPRDLTGDETIAHDHRERVVNI